MTSLKAPLKSIHPAVLLTMVAAALTTSVASPATAQDKYPASPIRLVVGSPAGGSSTDTFARLLAQKIAPALGVNIVADNRPGANANIAAELVAKATPNGYTLLFNTSGVVLSIALGEPLNYNLLTDLAPVALFTAAPYVIMVRPAVLANTAAELIELLRASPGKLSYGSAGTGNVTHLGMMLFLEANKLNALHVPYKGIAPALVDLTGGRLDLAMSSVVSAAPLIIGKRLRGLALTGLRRSSSLPDLPTLNESGMKGFEVSGWYGLMAPAKTPQAIVNRLNGEVRKVLQDADTLARLEQQGAQPFGSSVEAYAAYLKSELERWGRLIKQSQQARPQL